MPYVDSAGNIHNETPWGVAKVKNIFWEVINVIYTFFLTLFNPTMSKKGPKYKTDYRPPGGGPPKPPQRRMGGFGNGPDQIPMCATGG